MELRCERSVMGVMGRRRERGSDEKGADGLQYRLEIRRNVAVGPRP